METKETRKPGKPATDEFARDSFTWRRMKPSQIGWLVAAVIVMLLAFLYWG